jgi:hypothetical protein
VEKKKSVADQFEVKSKTEMPGYPVTQKPNKITGLTSTSSCCKRVNRVEQDKHSCFDLTNLAG